MCDAISILHLEHDPSDAARVETELRSSRIIARIRRIMNQGEFLAALNSPPPDLILANDGLPDLDSYVALALTRKRWQSVPFIFLSNSSGEEPAINALKRGANDFVSKRYLIRLSSSIRRAIAERTQNPAHVTLPCTEADRAIPILTDQEAQRQMLSGLLAICTKCKKIRDEDGQWNQLESYIQAHSHAVFTHGICPECLARLVKQIHAAKASLS